MITIEQADNLQPGDKLIFFKNGNVLSTKKGNVFTFARWYDRTEENYRLWREGKRSPDIKLHVRYFQAQEILDTGNDEHNLLVWDTELFDAKIHKEYRLMNAKELGKDYRAFVSVWGE